MPTGWRPEDVAEKYPISIIEDVYNFPKYKPEATNSLKAYAIYQLLASTFLMLFMFYNYSEIGFQNLLIFGAFVFIGIYGFTTLMDRKKHAVFIEIARSLAGLILLFYSGDWFGINNYLTFGSWLIAAYFGSTIVGALYFGFAHNRQEQASIA